MVIFLSLRCLALILLAVVVTSCPSDDNCHRQTFHEVSNRSYVGEILVREGPLPVNKCRRLCRQYLECWLFSFEWLEDKFGMCNIYNGVWNATQIVQKQDVSLYMSCPDGFEWDVKIRKCYTVKLYGPIIGTEIVKMCYNILPEAFPVEPRDSTQMNHIIETAGGRDIWMGMRKPDNFSDVHDFRYYSDGKPIEYEYWRKPDPNNYNNNEHCVLAQGNQELRWYDVICNIQGNIICQL
ncbi:hypothetical protein LSH36_1546g00009 [Paralvinella palmiformis]|uniref:C-type lectin domain-containing protein n=1 Tax=Paralvinella palmiformis TaxID=53620 RepID=A0AAD9MQF2_9ANNE|nr:hypothetical protein LSH36_1546g00009 [Paralvinella palmiformis]